MTSLSSLRKFSEAMDSNDSKMPLLFVGHGSPMNGIEDNEFSRRWKLMGKEIPLPKLVLCISAHWLTNGTKVTAMANPSTIHDFGGFPDELFKVQYPAPGSPAMANQTAEVIHKTNVVLDHEWGFDHGSWSVLRQMYPEAKIPIIQLSIDINKPAQYHYDLAKELAVLRQKGVLILGSGNMVHNLGKIAWDKPQEFAFDWAIEMNELFKQNILQGNHQHLINYEGFGAAGRNAIPSPDHYLPLIYILGLKEKNERITFFNDKAMMGSITMTSVKIDS